MRPADEHLGPVAVVREAVSLAEGHNGFGAVEHAIGIAAHLMKESSIRERERLAVQVIQSPRERDSLLGMRHCRLFVAEQPEGVRIPGVRKNAEVRSEGGTLRIALVVCRQRRFEMMTRRLELADAR